jgi:hypothetical protein
MHASMSTALTAAAVRSTGGSWSDEMKSLDYDGPELTGARDFDPSIYNGRARHLVLPDGSTFTIPNGSSVFGGVTGALIGSYEKAGLFAKVARERWKNFDRAQDTTAKFGAPREWEKFRFSFSKDEARILALQALEAQGKEFDSLTPREQEQALLDGVGDVITKIKEILARDFSRPINKGKDTAEASAGRRMMIIGPAHLDTGNVHFDIALHRFPIDIEKKIFYRQVDLSNYSAASLQLKQIRDIIRDDFGIYTYFAVDGKSFDLPDDMPATRFAVDSAPSPASAAPTAPTQEATAEPQPAIPGRDPYEPTPTGGISKRAVAEEFERMTGVPATPDKVGGPENIAPRRRFDPELQQLEDMVRLAQRKQEQATKMLRDGQTEESVAKHAREALLQAAESEAQRVRAQTEVVDLQNRLAMESEKLLRSEDKVSRLEGIIEQEPTRQAEAIQRALEPIEAELKAVREHAAREPERTAEAVKREVEPVQKQLDEASQQIVALRGELAESETKYVQSETRWSALLKAANEGWEATKKELASVKASLEKATDRISRIPDEIAKAVAQAEGKLEETMTKAFTRASELSEQAHAKALQAKDAIIATAEAAKNQALADLEAAKKGAKEDLEDLAKAKDAVIAGLNRTIESLRSGAAATAQAVATGATAVAEAIQPRKARGPTTVPAPPAEGADFAQSAPGDWTPAQRAFATVEHERRVKSNPKTANVTLEKWGETLHAAWLKKNAPRGPR